MIYLDWAATAKPNKKLILEAVQESMEYFANPSSIHNDGRKAKKRIEEARESIAKILKTSREKIFFTSGATEGTQIVFSSLLNQSFRNEIVISDKEHSATKEMAKAMQTQGYKLVVLKTEQDGFISNTSLLKSINTKTAIISLILVDNETGAIEPITRLESEIKKANSHVMLPYFHLDAVQALGKIPINLDALSINSAVFSGHKIGAMRGIGILYLKKPIMPFLRAGGQEKGMRGGTENLAAILSLEKCLLECDSFINERMQNAKLLKDFLITCLMKIKGIGVVSQDIMKEFLYNNYNYENKIFSPYIVSFYNHYLKGEVLVRMLSDLGIAISSGSACSSNSKDKRIIAGIPNQYSSNVARVSIGFETQKDDIEAFIQGIKKIMESLSWK